LEVGIVDIGIDFSARYYNGFIIDGNGKYRDILFGCPIPVFMPTGPNQPIGNP
jgi:hypothetical protein